LHEALFLGSTRVPRVRVGVPPIRFSGRDAGNHTRDGHTPQKDAIRKRILLRFPCPSTPAALTAISMCNMLPAMSGAAEEVFRPLITKEVVSGCLLSLLLPVSHGFRQPFRLLLAGVMVLGGCNPVQPRTSGLGPISSPSPVPTATVGPIFPDPGTTAVPVEPPPSTPQPQLGEPPRAK
jgi:hypothetical protein